MLLPDRVSRSGFVMIREIIIGHSRQHQLLLVSFTERFQKIRIISARQATRREREDYERNTF